MTDIIIQNREKRREGLFSRYSYYLPGFRGMISILLMFFIGNLMSVTAVMGIKVLIPGMSDSFITLVSYPLIFIPAMIYALVMSRRNKKENLPSTPVDRFEGRKLGMAGTSLTVIIATLAIAVVIEPTALLLPPMPEVLEEAMNSLIKGPFLLNFISVAIFAPFFEEWLCRGIVLRGLLSKTNPTNAILTSAVFFAVIHLNPWQALPAFIMGILFGYVYYKTGSIRLTMLMHSANNTMSLVISRIPALKDTDYIFEAMNGWSYGLAYVACLATAISSIIIIRTNTVDRSSCQTEQEPV